MIAIAWVAYRPLLGIGLLAAAVLLIVLLSLRGRARRKKRLAAQAVPAQAEYTPQAVPGQSYCHNCGAPQAAGTRFCAACGTAIRYEGESL